MAEAGPSSGPPVTPPAASGHLGLPSLPSLPAASLPASESPPTSKKRGAAAAADTPCATKKAKYKKSSIQRTAMNSVLAAVHPDAVLSEKARPSLANICDGVLVAVVLAVLEARPTAERNTPVTAADIVATVRASHNLAAVAAALTPETTVQLHPGLQAAVPHGAAVASAKGAASFGGAAAPAAEADEAPRRGLHPAFCS
mmetsp:Transcript_27395/g.71886  ORF Transcript_27395/g.71886 Transcript_27395/m.71886 type:complete len:200 (+) Transcript_27395:239-838(+)